MGLSEHRLLELSATAVPPQALLGGASSSASGGLLRGDARQNESLVPRGCSKVDTFLLVTGKTKKGKRMTPNCERALLTKLSASIPG